MSRAFGPPPATAPRFNAPSYCLMTPSRHLASFSVCLASLCFGFSWAHALGEQALWPRSGPGNPPSASHGEKAFSFSRQGATLTLGFKDIANSDDYTAIDLGPVNLAGYEQGGYVEVEVKSGNSILRISPTLAEAGNFWGTRQALEGGAILKPGTRAYRFYLDGLSPERARTARDNLYLFIQDLSGPSRGAAKLEIVRVTVKPPTPDWRERKAESYALQYDWPKIEKVEPLYYEEFDRAVDWDQVSSSPTLHRIPLDGAWQKKNFGEKTWDYGFLADETYASPEYAASSWEKVTAPEPATENQPGGHVWYRREIEVPAAALAERAKVYLRFADVADDARIYLNGQLVGTQTSAEKHFDWVAENGSRHRFGVTVEKGVTWQHFDRVGIPFPFERSAVPKNANRLVLPIYSGHEDWPFAYDVSDLVRPGKNTLALRVYGNPMRGWWIYRHREDRSARNIHGILGGATLAIQPRAAIASLVREPAATVAVDGRASQRFTCGILPEARARARSVTFRCGEDSVSASVSPAGSATASLLLPAHFGRRVVQAAVLDERGDVLETRELAFDGAVIEVAADRRLLVNGEPFQVRGINAAPGVEWDNDRRVTRREFFRALRFYQQLGINTLRMEPAADWQIEAAFEHGFMVMPTTAAASTDWSIGAFGQLVSPDLRLACDRHRLMAIQLNRHPNVLLWNGGNEIHHTPGYDDRPVLERYLEEIRDSIRLHDPSRRPVTYANLDMWKQNWFFFGGQDIVGWNTYKDAAGLRAEIDTVLSAAGGRPVLFTEWGMEKQSSRRDDLGRWEKEMRGKWEIISGTPGSIGGMIFAWHGELEDDRGREFLRELFLPFELSSKNGRVTLRNRSESTFRDLKLTVVAAGVDVPLADTTAALAPGETYEPRFLAPPPAGATLEISYETHGGLRHSFTQPL